MHQIFNIVGGWSAVDLPLLDICETNPYSVFETSQNQFVFFLIQKT